ncbi:MAG: diadenylate cyclase CdaA [Phycisphaerae bacterium]|nr:diadenylate cyclase CdaA [Phycisphaerae bacterium]
MKLDALLAQSNFLAPLRSFFEQIAYRPWLTLLEWFLIGAAVYTVLRFFHGTRGARLVRAVLLILAVSFAIVWLLAENFDSERIKVLYPYFIVSVFLVALVAFQVELRRMLLRVGDVGWLQHWVGRTEATIEPIVLACERMSKKKIGALIALDRTGEVGALVDTGVRLDAEVSTELLETIFWPGTSLHDLGVIIHQGRIVAAGCQFPLAESGEVDRTLGSRHRAGLGMSHEAEAVVIIVSEETGTISVANRGRLRRGLSAETLREFLRKELTAPAAARVSKRRRWFARRSPTGVASDGASQTA